MVRPTINKQQQSKGRGIVAMTCIFVVGFCLGHWHAAQGMDGSPLPASGSPTTSLLTIPDRPGSVTTTTSGIVSNNNNNNKREYGNGWHSVEVFYGKTDHLERMLPKNLEWFSQARQDEAIITFLKGKRNGYFVDLAANDATVLSNTYSLEKKFGWTGLCIEPNPMYWANLTYRDCQVVAAIVGNQRMEEVRFRFDNGDHGGITGAGFDNGENVKRKAEPKYTVTLKEILQRFNAPKQIDYLSLDVEGAEEFIMKNFPLNDYTISMMTVERPRDSLRSLFDKNGFKFVKRLSSWGETVWAHESIMDTLDLSRLEDFTPTRKPKQEGEEAVG
jgi:hypothetical protein